MSTEITMQRILFYEDGQPIDPRCIKRFVHSFPKGYKKVVRDIIEKSEKIDGDNESKSKEIFKENIVELMSSFKMTRAGPFYGIKTDPNGILDECWNKIGCDLLKLKKYLKDTGLKNRARVIVDVSDKTKNEIFEMTDKLFEALRQVPEVYKGGVLKGRVGASKILFSVLPEIALPVDNTEWKEVFKTDYYKYKKILEIMAGEITEWEKQTNQKLECPDGATLPSVYNIMAMTARP